MDYWSIASTAVVVILCFVFLRKGDAGSGSSIKSAGANPAKVGARETAPLPASPPRPSPFDAAVACALRGDEVAPTELTSAIATILAATTSLKSASNCPPQPETVRALVTALTRRSGLGADATSDACEALYYLLRNASNQDIAKAMRADQAFTAALRAHGATTARVSAMGTLGLRTALQTEALLTEALCDDAAVVAATQALRSHVSDSAVVHPASLALVALLTPGRPAAAAAADAALRAGLEPALSSAFAKHGSDPGVLVALTCLLGYAAAASPEARDALARGGALPRVLGLLESGSDESIEGGGSAMGVTVAAAYAIRALLTGNATSVADAASGDTALRLLAVMERYPTTTRVTSACCYGLAMVLRQACPVTALPTAALSQLTAVLSRHPGDEAIVEGASAAMRLLAPTSGGPTAASDAIVALSDTLALHGSGSESRELSLGIIASLVALLEVRSESIADRDKALAAATRAVPAAVAALTAVGNDIRYAIACCHLLCALLGVESPPAEATASSTGTVAAAEAPAQQMQSQLGQRGAVTLLLGALARLAADVTASEACLATLGRLIANHEENTLEAVRADAIRAVVQALKRHAPARAAVAQHAAFVLLACVAGRVRSVALRAAATCEAVPALQHALARHSEDSIVGPRIAAAIVALRGGEEN